MGSGILYYGNRLNTGPSTFVLCSKERECASQPDDYTIHLYTIVCCVHHLMVNTTIFFNGLQGEAATATRLDITLFCGAREKIERQIKTSNQFIAVCW